MSRNLKVNADKKPYCKVCHDAGKSESEYSNHWVRTLPDRSGKTTITCPTLLTNECRYCYQTGHTAKFCPVLEKNKKETERAERQVTRKEEETKKKVKTENLKPMKRGFTELQEDSSDSEGENIKVSILPTTIEEFPALCAPSKPKIAVHLPSIKSEIKSWAAAAASKPNVVVPIEKDTFLSELEERSMIKNLPQSAMKTKKIVPLLSIKPTDRDMTKKIYTTNWDDWSDHDSDSDEENQIADKGAAILMPYKKTVCVAVDDYDSDW